MAASLSMAAHAEGLSFSETADAVAHGKQLAFVLDLKKCEADFPVADITTSIRPNAFMLIGKDIITASDRHFTLDDPSLKGTPAFGYGKYVIHADGHATLKITLMRASDYVKVNEFEIRCELGQGISVFE